MDHDYDPRPVPSLVTLCQRGQNPVFIAIGPSAHLCLLQQLPWLMLTVSLPLLPRNVDSHVLYLGITSLGDDLTYHLVKPILEKCSIEQLQRLEESSPVSSAACVRAKS